MANNTVPEVPMNPDKLLQPPLNPGVDHPASVASLRADIATAAGVPVEDVVPAQETAEELAKSNVNNYLEKMGAVEPETSFKPETPSDNLTKFKEDVEAFNPLSEETDRTGASSNVIDLKEERKKKMEEKKAA